MGQLEKLIGQFINTPNPKWDEVISLMKKLGYIKIEKKGSRMEFWHEAKNSSILLHKPHPENTIKSYTKKDIIDKLKKAGFINETL
jgi:predicted RNA binding protein YcfA (HicA-like mRNA interferase family)